MKIPGKKQGKKYTKYSRIVWQKNGNKMVCFEVDRISKNRYNL